MNILVLGGTQFSGRSFVEQASDAGHQVTVLHRSPEAPGLPDAVRHLVGDRDPKDPGNKGDGLGAIKALLDNGERFDSVIDMCGYTPRVVRASCEILKDHTDQYTFISTISVYDKAPADAVLDEDAPKVVLADPTIDPSFEELSNENYGGLKVLCEQVVTEIFPDNHCIPRPCVIAGPNDPTDRVTWWARMLNTQDAMMIPTGDVGYASFIDSRDLGAFFLHCATNKIMGIFNTTGPEPDLPLTSFIQRTHNALESKTTMIEADLPWFESQDITPWKDIPTWLPAESQYMHRHRSDRARAVGLTNRPLEDTMRAIRDWDQQRGASELKAGMKPERMQAAVDAMRV